MKGWRKKGGRGRPVIHRTWFALWMSMKELTIPELARIIMCSTASVERWRAGRPIDRHMARLIKAFFPDVPIHSFGGPVVKIDQPLPIQSRSTEMYKFIFKMGGLIDGLANPEAIERARGVVA